MIAEEFFPVNGWQTVKIESYNLVGLATKNQGHDLRKSYPWLNFTAKKAVLNPFKAGNLSRIALSLAHRNNSGIATWTFTILWRYLFEQLNQRLVFVRQ